MQFVDLKAQYAQHKKAIDARIERVLDHGQYIMGPEVRELEERLEEYVGIEHCISCASGTDGLVMALLALGVGPGDAVFTTPFTFVATAEAVALVGATPVFVDIDPQTFNISPALLAQQLDTFERTDPLSGRPLRPAAIIAVDLFGLPACYDELLPLARTHGLTLIEDAAQSFGASLRGRRAGALADIGVTSFYPAKPLGCYGDGGAVFTANAELAQLLRSIRVHGMGQSQYHNVRVGINGRLDTIQAAVLLAKLDSFDEELDARQRIAHRYSAALPDSLVLPTVAQGYCSAWAQYSVLSEQRDALRERLSQRGVPSMVYYPQPLHLQPAFASLGYARGSLPVAERCAESILSLPMHPFLSQQQQEQVIEALK
jgi:UDP-2-acetamido-2-deoxy-ribo-hexuluronate aminotransferase